MLLDTKALALPGGVIGIEHTGNILSLVLLGQRTQVVLVIKCIEIQLLLCLALPQTEGVDIIGAVTDNGHIVRHSQHGVIRELHLYRMVITTVGPGITELRPIVCILLLAAVCVKALLKQTKLIPQAVTGQRNIDGSSAIQEAGSKAAQATVTQRSILNILQHRQVNALVSKKLLHLVQNTQIVHIGIYKTADQIFGGNVVGFALMHTGMLGTIPVIGNGHHHRLTQSLMELLGRSLL